MPTYQCPNYILTRPGVK